jgi:hypothetical protein
MLPLLALGLGVALGAPGPALAGEADVVDARVECRPAPGGRDASICKFAVSVRHADEGWDHYANRYEILAPDGQVLATRVLRHPHVEEQPFTRGISRVRIPHAVDEVTIRAGDLVHGLGGAELQLKVPHSDASPAPREPAAGEGGP